MCKMFGNKKIHQRERDTIRFGHDKGWFRMAGNEN